MNAILRERIDSVAGAMDEAHGRPFVLGRPFRLPRPGFARWPEDVKRVWLACVRVDRYCYMCAYMNCGIHCERRPCARDCDHREWRDDYAFSDREVFIILP